MADKYAHADGCAPGHRHGHPTPHGDVAAIADLDRAEGALGKRRCKPEPYDGRDEDDRLRVDLAKRAMHSACDLRVGIRRDERKPEDDTDG